MPNTQTIAPPSLVVWEDGAHTLIATQGEILVALSTRDGKEFTRYHSGGSLVGPPAQRGGALYVCFRSRDPKAAYTVQALRLEGGEISPIWSYSSAGGRLSAPVAAEDTVYVQGGDRLHALRSSDGALLWTSQVEVLLGTQAVSGGVIYVVAAANAEGQPAAVYALRASSGSLLWRATLPETPTPSLPTVVAGEALYIPDLQGVCALAANGDFLWKRELAAGVYGSAVVVNDVIYFSFSFLDLSSREGSGGATGPGGRPGRHISLVALRPDGTTLWQQRVGAGTEATFVTAPAVLPGEHAVVIGTNDGTAYALRQDDGSLLWRCGAPQRQKLAIEVEEQTLEAESAADGKLLATPIVLGKVVYVGANDGFVYALSARTGIPLWRSFIGAEVTTTFAYASLPGV
jgi:outer membrane protein assembly factor BamB